MIEFILLINRQGKIRLAKWYVTIPQKEQARIIREVCQVALNRPLRLSNVVEIQGRKFICRRYASLYFIACVQKTENELIAMEAIHHFVEVLDRYYGNVCELDLVFNFHRAYFILDELILGGEVMEASRKAILKNIDSHDAAAERSEENIAGSSIVDQVSNALKRL